MLRDLRVHVECVYMLTATAPFYISLLAAAPAVTLWAHGAGQAAAMLQLQLQTSDSLRSWFPLNLSDDLLLSGTEILARGHAVVTHSRRGFGGIGRVILCIGVILCGAFPVASVASRVLNGLPDTHCPDTPESPASHCLEIHSTRRHSLPPQARRAPPSV